MGGRFGPESVAGFGRNGWPVYAGISGRIGPEYAPGAGADPRQLEVEVRDLALYDTLADGLVEVQP